MLRESLRLSESRWEAAMRATCAAIAVALGLWLGLVPVPASAADRIAVGVVSSEGGVPAYVAAAEGYFAAEGLDAKLVQFTSAGAIAPAATAGAVDFASTAMSAAFVNLAAAGTLTIIGSGSVVHAGFHTIGIIASNQAYAAGLRRLSDLGGHSVAVTQVGSPLEYDLGLVLKKNAVPLAKVRVLALQSNLNIASALKGGEVDAAVQSASNVDALLQRGDAKLLGWVDDETPGALGTVTFTTRAMATAHPDRVQRFLAAFRKGGARWDAAFVDTEGQRKDSPDAPHMIAVLSKALDQPQAIIASGLEYFDPEARIDLASVQEVLDWYAAHGKIKQHVDAASLIDKRSALLTGK